MTLLWARWLNQTISRGPFQQQLFCDPVKPVSSVIRLQLLPARQFQSNSWRQSATNTSNPLRSLWLAETGRIHTADCPLAQYGKYERKELCKREPSEGLVPNSRLFALFVTTILMYAIWLWRFPNSYQWVYFVFPWLMSCCWLHATPGQRQDKAIQKHWLERRKHVTT